MEQLHGLRQRKWLEIIVLGLLKRSNLSHVLYEVPNKVNVTKTVTSVLKNARIEVTLQIIDLKSVTLT